MKSVDDTATVEALHFAPDEATFFAEVMDGLTARPKTLPCKYFYDARGSQLFERICALAEYYPTRTELDIMMKHAPEMAQFIGARAVLIEYGSGTSTKTRVLLDYLEKPAAYVPIDISRDHLLRAAADVNLAYPDLAVLPVCADYTGDFELPDLPQGAGARVVYFPGSTIGNFDPADIPAFFGHVADVVGAGGGFLIGVDLVKPRETLELAYNDAAGVTAAFNKNILARINRELDGRFDLDAFEHRAHFNAERSRIEMHLVSRRDQAVRIGGTFVAFRRGESIHTESSYKYSLDSFASLAEDHGFRTRRVFLDDARLFSVRFLTYRG
ncbi:L-histidine N(alpha)-methyltransferase [bacterium]|nr:L-histidine N(alpha)-methyltransferase [bacterium]